jgi:hypothetical protein
MGESGVGNTYVMEDDADLELLLRAILDIGLWICNHNIFETEDPDITIVDASSDIFTIDISNSKRNK